MDAIGREMVIGGGTLENECLIKILICKDSLQDDHNKIEPIQMEEMINDSSLAGL